MAELGKALLSVNSIYDSTIVLGYPELCHNRLDCFCFVLNLVGVEQN